MIRQSGLWKSTKIVGFSCPYCDALNEFETLNNYDSMDELILAKRLLQQILRLTDIYLYFNKIISVTWSYNELYKLYTVFL